MLTFAYKCKHFLKMEKNIFLSEFRKDNKITQQELADFFCTTRSFLSLVESGKSKLPKDKIDMIYGDGLSIRNWNARKFNPAYYRLYELAQHINSKGGGYPVVFDWRTGENLLFISPTSLDDIRYGKSGITEAIADDLLKGAPDINRDWLIYGYGNMILPIDNQRPNNYAENNIHMELGKIDRKIQHIENTLLELTNLLSQMKAQMQNNSSKQQRDI